MMTCWIWLINAIKGYYMLNYPNRQQQRQIANAKKRFARKDIQKEIEKEQKMIKEFKNVSNNKTQWDNSWM